MLTTVVTRCDAAPLSGDRVTSPAFCSTHRRSFADKPSAARARLDDHAGRPNDRAEIDADGRRAGRSIVAKAVHGASDRGAQLGREVARRLRGLRERLGFGRGLGFGRVPARQLLQVLHRLSRPGLFQWLVGFGRRSVHRLGRQRLLDVRWLCGRGWAPAAQR